MKTELHELLESRLRRRAFLLLGLTAFAGCSTPFLRGNKDRVGLDSLAAEQDENAVKLVSDYAAPWGLQYKKIEAVALVTNLDHTGSDPPPDGYRSMLLADMQGRDVKKPNDLLASDKTSLVLVTAYLPPAVKKGDPLDVELRVPTKSTTTSLRGGWLMQCRLREMAVVKGRTHTGHEAGLAQGNVVVSSIFLGEREKINEVRARVLGGAVAISERKLGLVVHRSDVSIETTSVIGNAVNARFHTFDRGEKKGVAEPKNANFIELLLPTRYRQNMGRFVNVVRAVPLRESAAQRLVRLEQLEQQLMNPETSLKASFALEAIGREGIPTLKKGLASPEVDVRFHAAEALAYLEEPEAAKVLTAAAREEAAFRRAALAALASMDHVQAYEGLTELLHLTSAETRYGAFRSLRLRNPHDPLVKGERLKDQFHLHWIPSRSEPLIHISSQERAEIVLFGQELRLVAPQGIFAGKEIMLTSSDSEQVKISRFTPGKEDQVVYTGTEVGEIIRALVELGATYGDVVQVLHEAKKANNIAARVAVDALPTADRVFERESAAGENIADEADPTGETKQAGRSEADLAAEIEQTYVDPAFSPQTSHSVWSRLTGWFGRSEK